MQTSIGRPYSLSRLLKTTPFSICINTHITVQDFSSEKSQWISGLNNIFYMFSTLICVFTLDRIGRRWTLYWGMFESCRFC
jgi:MFS family permease